MVLIAFAAVFACSGCIYRMNIQQGNFLKPEDVDRVQTGMTRSQVRFILGTPMINDAFDTSRWDYYYYLVKGHSRHMEKRHVVVQFDSDKVVRVERLLMPGTPAKPQPEKPAPAPNS
jgi:outer membrane protein assembly factor BamE